MTKSEFPRKEALVPVQEARRAGDVDALVNIVNRESDLIVRGVAIYELGSFRDPRAVETLRRLLTAGEFYVRVASIRALARIGDGSVSNDLYRLAKDDRCHIGIRLTASAALVKLGDRRVIPVIAQFVVDDRYSRGDVKWALKKLRASRGVEAIPILRSGGSRQLNAIDRLRIRMLIRKLESERRDG